jgi:DNA-binding transcriptional LysR family regulator
VMTKVLGPFLQTYPFVKPRIDEIDCEAIVRGVKEGTIDFGITSTPACLEGIQCELLLRAPVGVFFNSSKFDVPAKVNFKFINSLPIIKLIDNPAMKAWSRQIPNKSCLEPSMDIDTPSLALQLALVKSGLGVVVLSALDASNTEFASLKFAPLEPICPHDFYIVSPLETPRQSNSKILIEMILSLLPHLNLHPSVRRFSPNVGARRASDLLNDS